MPDVGWKVFSDKINKKELNNQFAILEFGSFQEDEENEQLKGGVKIIEKEISS